MSHASTVDAVTRAAVPPQRSLSTVMAFMIGLPLGIAILAGIQMGPLGNTIVGRYVSHPVEMVSVVLFACACGALLTKLLGYGKELLAFRVRWLPTPTQTPEPIERINELIEHSMRQNRRLQRTYLGRRVLGILDFVQSRQTADDLDDHMRGLADNDDITLEGSYSLIRFITWAIPILGFLGTVLGITGAISGVKPEDLENNLSAVTDGLATAFDTTAVALALTMVIMFFNFIVERLEQSLLEKVNRYADQHLAHRFERASSEGSLYVEILRRNTQVVLESMEKLIERQVAIWSQTMHEARQQWQQSGAKQQQFLTNGIEQALLRTLEVHAERLQQQEHSSAQSVGHLVQRLDDLSVTISDTAHQQQQSLAEIMHQVSTQTQVLAQLADSGAYLARIQEALQQNLNALAGTGAFEQAVHNLTAAIHLLTARVNAGPVPPGQVSHGNRLARPGVAA